MISIISYLFLDLLQRMPLISSCILVSYKTLQSRKHALDPLIKLGQQLMMQYKIFLDDIANRPRITILKLPLYASNCLILVKCGRLQWLLDEKIVELENYSSL